VFVFGIIGSLQKNGGLYIPPENLHHWEVAKATKCQLGLSVKSLGKANARRAPVCKLAGLEDIPCAREALTTMAYAN